MMYLETPPRLIETQVFSAMPKEFRRSVRTDWADANRPGAPTDCFIEGPSFDASGNLYIVDIPFGRIFKISPDKKWSLVVEYDGWPNGLKIDAKSRILVADYMHGIMELDARAGKMLPVLTAHNSESFKGCNDLHIASSGDIYFTDQGQTGLHDPTGRVHRLRTSGQLDCLINTGISPNGLVLDPSESVLFIAIFYGIAIIWERDLGVINKFLVSPTPRLALVLGKALSAGARALPQAIIIYLLSAILGVQINWNPLALLGVIVIVMLGAACFSTFSMIIACLLKTRDRVRSRSRPSWLAVSLVL